MAFDYEILTAETVPGYVERTDWLNSIVDAGTLRMSEVGDGNLNLVFVGSDAAGRGLCVKQALPYLRLVGESWPLTPHRATSEALAYREAMEYASEFIPEFYGFDQENFALAMENLAEWEVWRTTLNRGEVARGVEAQLGTFVARMAFHTSLFMLDATEHKARIEEALNPQLCEITEQLVFTEPYIEHEHNSYDSDIDSNVLELREDPILRECVQRLKYKFMTCAESLIHGDLHTGSVMVRQKGAGFRAKAIDPEFCYYGPVGFDLGALFGNYLAARARAVVLDRPEEFRAWVDGLAAATWDAFELEMRRLWPNREADWLGDEFLESWLKQVLQDAAGFGGCKAIRRVIGLAKISDLETLESADKTVATTATLKTAADWIREGHNVASVGTLLAIAERHL